jgi:type IV pilus assembly protein PilQ
MHTLLRITLLTVGAAIGIAVALAVALQTPPPADPPAISSSPAEGESRATQAANSDAPEAATTAAAPQIALTPSVALTPVVAPYRDPVSRQVGQLEETLQQFEESSHRRERSMLRAIAALQDQIQIAPPAALAVQQPPANFPAAPAPATAPTAEDLPLSNPEVRKAEGDDGLTINIQNSDIRHVLELLSQEAGLNIVASKNVTGTVTANLAGVDVQTALAAILKSTGFVAVREGNILYVGEPRDLAAMNQIQDKVQSRIYRPNYVRAADFQQLITPMLTPEIGKITVTSPAQVDIPADQVKTGGNSFADTDVIIVRDYAAVLAEIDQIFEEVDVKPRQVAIEAMILSVNLSDTYKLGVNFEALRNQNNVRLISGTPLANLGSINPAASGLKFGFMDASLSLFIDALETIGDTNVIAAPRLTCLNKQRAEIQIGEELGYVSTTVTESAATQTVNFLDVGTLLRIRPFIGNDGLIRLEVHPELSTGFVDVRQGLSLPQKAVTQVTTNVLCPDGCTVVIGGLIREDLTTTTKQIPLLGSLPWVGPVFRQKDETIDRSEIIVLITPRIVSDPFLSEEGAKYGNDFTQRQSIYFNKMSPIGQRNLGQHHLRQARAAYNAGDFNTAMKQVNLAIHYDPQSRDNVVLRNEIVAAGGFEDESIHEYLNRGLAPLTARHRDYSRLGYPWKEFEGIGPPEPAGFDDRGQIGPTRTIERQPPAPSDALRTTAPPTKPSPDYFQEP